MTGNELDTILARSLPLRHLLARVNTRVKVHMKDVLVIEGNLTAVDYPNMWVEVEGLKKTWFVNMHKIAAIEAIPSEEAVSIAEKRRNGK